MYSGAQGHAISAPLALLAGFVEGDRSPGAAFLRRVLTREMPAGEFARERIGGPLAGRSAVRCNRSLIG
jgi:hypothetical protein